MKSVTFEFFGKCLESVNFDANNDLQEDLKIFKSDTFENYKNFVHAEVQNLCSFVKLCGSKTLLEVFFQTSSQ